MMNCSLTSILLTASALAMMASAAAAGEITWVVSEGPNAERSGVWHVQELQGRIAGTAAMSDRTGRKIVFAIRGEKRGDEFTLQRSNPSDGLHCAYRGRIAGNGRIDGAMLCGTTTSVWTAVKQ